MSSWDKKLKSEPEVERRFASQPNSTNAFVSGSFLQSAKTDGAKSESRIRIVKTIFDVRILCLQAIGNNVNCNRQEMKNTAHQNKNVPDGVMMADAFPREEDNADAVCQTARDDERDRSESERGG